MFDIEYYKHESNVLGTIIIAPEIGEAILDQIEPDLFTSESLQRICVAIIRLAAKHDIHAVSEAALIEEDKRITIEELSDITSQSIPSFQLLARSLKILKVRASTQKLKKRMGTALTMLEDAPNMADDVLKEITSAVTTFSSVASSGVVQENDIVRPIDIFDTVEEVFRPTTPRNKGIPLPWSKTTDWFRIRPSEVTIWSGINSHGKSLLLSDICAYLMFRGENVLIASMEMTPASQMERLYRQILCKQLPKADEHKACAEWIGDCLRIINITGSAKASRILDLARYSVKKHGATQVIIDSLAKCGFAEDDYNSQKAFVEDLTDFAKETGAHVHLVAHPRKSEDEKTAPGKMDVRGAAAITDMCDNLLVVWRNKKKEEKIFFHELRNEEAPEEVRREPCVTVGIHKQRHYSWEGKFGLWFRKAEMRYVDRYGCLPEPYFKLNAD